MVEASTQGVRVRQCEVNGECADPTVAVIAGKHLGDVDPLTLDRQLACPSPLMRLQNEVAVLGGPLASGIAEPIVVCEIPRSLLTGDRAVSGIPPEF